MENDTEQPKTVETELVQPNQPSETQPLSSTFTQEYLTYTDEQGNELEYKQYLPSNYEEGTDVPLVVMLHGCTQDPDTFAAGTRMNEIAEREDFIVVYPKQSQTRHMWRCWTWFDESDTGREEGEAPLIAGMTRQLLEDHSIDSDRVYVAGLSAGGAMAANLAAYSELFAAIGIHSGLGYDAADNENEAITIMRDASGYDPQAKGTQAYEDMGEHARVVPTIVFHGNRDGTVNPENGTHAAEQSTQMNDLASDDVDDDNIDFIADKVINGQVDGFPISRRYTRSEYHDENGDLIVAKYVIDGLGHAWSGGSPNGTFTDPAGPDASQLMWDFFESHTGTTKPVADAQSRVTTIGESITFYGRGSFDPDGSIASYEWEFGDGETASGDTVSHEYDAPGEYTVQLTVTDDDGNTATDTINVIIEDI